MQSIRGILSGIKKGDFNNRLKTLYGKNQMESQKERYINLLEEFMIYFKKDEDTKVFIISAPGRTEIGGNHTDHQNGCVLTSAINLDIIGVIEINNGNFGVVKSEGFKENRVDIKNLTVVKEDKNTSTALLRGVLEGVKNHGGKIGGFNAYTKSDVLKGSGLSSSAAFEVLIGNILNYGYNNGEISPINIAKIGRYAENKHFFKPSGLLDQMASSVGGLIFIDFKDDEPIVKKISYNFKKTGCTLCTIDTGGTHADLTDDYSAIPREMGEVASYFGKKVLQEVKEEEFYKNIKILREKFGDRAVLRSIHFFSENKRVKNQKNALENGDFSEFLKLINQSGRSSFSYLQNVSTFKDKNVQNIPVALALSDEFIKGDGAFRVHGGGFSGTILAFIKEEDVLKYKEIMEDVFGKDSFYQLFIREEGGIKVTMLS